MTGRFNPTNSHHQVVSKYETVQAAISLDRPSLKALQKDPQSQIMKGSSGNRNLQWKILRAAN